MRRVIRAQIDVTETADEGADLQQLLADEAYNLADEVYVTVQDVPVKTFEELQGFIDRAKQAGVSVVVLNPVCEGCGYPETEWEGTAEAIKEFAAKEGFEHV